MREARLHIPRPQMIVALMLLAAVLVPVPARSQVVTDPATPQACAEPDRSVELIAKSRKNGKVAYGLAGQKPSIPGPVLEMTEGECLAVTLKNNAGRDVSFHPHGVDYTVASDGTPHNGSCVSPGGSRTYVISSHAPTTRANGTIDPGSAGYWHYHDHCMGTTHGTVGVAKGLFGALVVRRADDPLPDKTVTLVMMGTTFNMKRHPKTPMPQANLGEVVEFVVIGHGELFHTFHLHGHRWADTRNGYVTSEEDSARVIDNKTVGPADSFGFQVTAGEHVGPGAWMYHCHVQSHSDLGMEGLFIVRTAEGELAPGTQEAIDAWRSGSHH